MKGVLEAVESPERAYDNGDLEEAAEYMEEIRHTQQNFWKSWNVIRRR